MANGKDVKILQIQLPADLYDRFSASNLRRECQTDVEAIRGMLRIVLDSEQACQQVNPSPVGGESTEAEAGV